MLKRREITSQPASSFLFFPSQSESVFPLSSLSLSDGLCWGQTESPAAGRLQTIVLIPLFCSLPTYLTNIHAAPHLLSLQGCRRKHTGLQTRKIQMIEKACLLVRSHVRFTHQTSWCTCHPTLKRRHKHTRIHTHLPSVLHSWSLVVSLCFHCTSKSFLFPSFTLSSRLPSISLFFLTFFEPRVY